MTCGDLTFALFDYVYIYIYICICIHGIIRIGHDC